MANVDSRYDVTIMLDIRDATTGEPTKFSKTIQEYSNMPYEFMQNVQNIAIPALVQMLLAPGNAIAEEIATARAQSKDKPKEKQNDKLAR